MAETDCDCDFGWRWVSDRYAEHSASEVGRGEGVLLSAVVAAFANSVYPCKECRPGMFYRWAGGHLNRDHDAGNCVDCADARGRTVPKQVRRAAGKAESSPPPPTDDDAPEPDLWQQRADLA